MISRHLKMRRNTRGNFRRGRGSGSSARVSALENFKAVLYPAELDPPPEESGSTMLTIENRVLDRLENAMDEIDGCPEFVSDGRFLDVLEQNRASNANPDNDYAVASSSEEEDGQDLYGFGGPKTNENDLSLMGDFLAAQRSSKYQQMLKSREKLPAFKYRDELLQTINENQVTLISGETGELQTFRLFLSNFIEESTFLFKKNQHSEY